MLRRTAVMIGQPAAPEMRTWGEIPGLVPGAAGSHYRTGINLLDVVDEVVVVFEIQFLSQPVSAHLHAAEGDIEQGGDLFRTQSHFQIATDQPVAGRKVGMPFEQDLGKVLVGNIEVLGEIFHIPVAAHILFDDVLDLSALVGDILFLPGGVQFFDLVDPFGYFDQQFVLLCDVHGRTRYFFALLPYILFELCAFELFDLIVFFQSLFFHDTPLFHQILFFLLGKSQSRLPCHVPDQVIASAACP